MLTNKPESKKRCSQTFFTHVGQAMDMLKDSQSQQQSLDDVHKQSKIPNFYNKELFNSLSRQWQDTSSAAREYFLLEQITLLTQQSSEFNKIDFAHTVTLLNKLSTDQQRKYLHNKILANLKDQLSRWYFLYKSNMLVPDLLEPMLNNICNKLLLLNYNLLTKINRNVLLKNELLEEILDIIDGVSSVDPTREELEYSDEYYPITGWSEFLTFRRNINELYQKHNNSVNHLASVRSYIEIYESVGKKSKLPGDKLAQALEVNKHLIDFDIRSNANEISQLMIEIESTKETSSILNSTKNLKEVCKHFDAMLQHGISFYKTFPKKLAKPVLAMKGRNHNIDANRDYIAAELGKIKKLLNEESSLELIQEVYELVQLFKASIITMRHPFISYAFPVKNETYKIILKMFDNQIKDLKLFEEELSSQLKPNKRIEHKTRTIQTPQLSQVKQATTETVQPPMIPLKPVAVLLEIAPPLPTLRISPDDQDKDEAYRLKKHKASLKKVHDRQQKSDDKQAPLISSTYTIELPSHPGGIEVILDEECCRAAMPSDLADELINKAQQILANQDGRKPARALQQPGVKVVSNSEVRSKELNPKLLWYKIKCLGKFADSVQIYGFLSEGKIRFNLPVYGNVHSKQDQMISTKKAFIVNP